MLPSPEVCDGRDNDCMNGVDDGVGDGEGEPEIVRVDAVATDSMRDNGSPYGDNRVRAYNSDNLNIVGWVGFDLSDIPDDSTVTGATLYMHGENNFGSPVGEPAVDIFRTDGTPWTRGNVTLPQVGLTERVAENITTFTPTAYNAFALTTDSWSYDEDLADDWVAFGLDQILDGYRFVYFLGTDDPNTAPYLELEVATGCGGGGGACTNGSETDCNPEGATINPEAAFVDPNPPEGWLQCAGFRNTEADDVAWNWEQNCLGHEARLRLRGWDDETQELLWDTIVDRDSDAEFTAFHASGENVGGSEGLTLCEGDTPSNQCGITLWRTETDANPCGCTYEGQAISCADIFSGNAENNKIIYVGGRGADVNEVFIAPPGPKNTCTIQEPVQRAVRVAIYEQVGR